MPFAVLSLLQSVWFIPVQPPPPPHPNSVSGTQQPCYKLHSQAIFIIQYFSLLFTNLSPIFVVFSSVSKLTTLVTFGFSDLVLTLQFEETPGPSLLLTYHCFQDHKIFYHQPLKIYVFFLCDRSVNLCRVDVVGKKPENARWVRLLTKLNDLSHFRI